MVINTIKKHDDFLKAAKSGKKYYKNYVIVNYIKNSNEKLRIGFTASKKVGKATKRNFAKRRLRAAIHNLLKQNPSFLEKNLDLILIAKKTILTAKWSDFTAEFNQEVSYIINKN